MRTPIKLRVYLGCLGPCLGPLWVRGVFCARQEEAEELRRSLRGISDNLDQLETGDLMWHEVSLLRVPRACAPRVCAPCLRPACVCPVPAPRVCVPRACAPRVCAPCLCLRACLPSFAPQFTPHTQFVFAACGCVVCVRVRACQFVVFIVADGRDKISKSMMEYMERDLKLLDPTMMLSEHRGMPVTAHLFEKTIDLPKHSSQVWVWVWTWTWTWMLV